MCCIREKTHQMSLSRTLTLCFKFLHENSLRIFYLSYIRNLGFLTCSCRDRGLFSGEILPYCREMSKIKKNTGRGPTIFCRDSWNPITGLCFATDF